MRKQGLATCVLHIKTPLNGARRSFKRFVFSHRPNCKKKKNEALDVCDVDASLPRCQFPISISLCCELATASLTLRVVLLVSALVCLSRFLLLRHVYYHPSSTVFVKLAAFCPIVRTADHRGGLAALPHFRSSLN